MGLRAVLVSPEFLFRIEQDPNGVAAEVRISRSATSNWLRACRSSSGAASRTTNCSMRRSRESCGRPACWNSRSAACSPMSARRRWSTNFAEQWLYLRNLASSNPDMRIFAGFDDNLRQAFRRETELFFESVMREDRSVLDLLGADYTFLNERLAKHYGIPNVYGSRFRRVELGREHAPRRAAAPGQHSDGDFVRQPDLAGDSRANGFSPIFWDVAAPAAAGRCSAAEGNDRRGEGRLHARTHGAAPRQSRLARAATT